MSAQHEIHSDEQKPVSFTVPLILAIVAIFVTCLFVSLCDPKSGHTDLHENHATLKGGHKGTGDASKGTDYHDANAAPEAGGGSAAEHH
jgi:hypothetical protein